MGNSQAPFDSFLLLSFGGPEASDEVMPFLRHVTDGRGVPDERLQAVASHYHHFGGVSPINGQNRALLERIQGALAVRGHVLPAYWGNRHAKPFLGDALDQMRADGRQNALVFVTSAYSSYSGCRQYRDAMEAELKDGFAYKKLPAFFDHPLWIESWSVSIARALSNFDAEHVLFTAHSIPSSMAAGCGYETQLRETIRLAAARSGTTAFAHELVFQSRSGPPSVPWLGPDIGERLRALASKGLKRVLIVPIGFLSDHMEVVWDLDHELVSLATDLGVTIQRAATVSTQESFIAMVCEMAVDACNQRSHRQLSTLGRTPVPCSETCCPRPLRRP